MVSANALIIGIPEISATLKMVPEVKLLSIKNNCPDEPSNESELSLNTLRVIGEFPELKKLNVNEDEPVFPNVPELNNNAPETPNPEPILTLPETPKPPVTVNAPVVEDVELVLFETLRAPLIVTVELNTAAPLTVNPPVTPSPPAVIFTLEANVATPDTDNVDEAVNAPTEVKEVWNVEAPVIPIPPEVTNNAAA